MRRGPSARMLACDHHCAKSAGLHALQDYLYAMLPSNSDQALYQDALYTIWWYHDPKDDGRNEGYWDTDELSLAYFKRLTDAGMLKRTPQLDADGLAYFRELLESAERSWTERCSL